MSKPLLAYWDIRGLVEPIRLMLEHSKVDYEQKDYVCGPAPGFDKSCWFDVKETLGLSFPNLPYYIDGDVKISESWAIMRHIARKTGLLPDSEVACALADQAQGVVQDFRMSFVMMCYRPGFEENKAAFFKQLPAKLSRFDAYLKSNKWLSGSKLTYVDFAFAEILDQLQLMETEVFEKYPFISEYLKTFMKMENVASYRNSPRFHKFPCNNRMAKWGGQKE